MNHFSKPANPTCFQWPQTNPKCPPPASLCGITTIDAGRLLPSLMHWLSHLASGNARQSIAIKLVYIWKGFCIYMTYHVSADHLSHQTRNKCIHSGHASSHPLGTSKTLEIPCVSAFPPTERILPFLENLTVSPKPL